MSDLVTVNCGCEYLVSNPKVGPRRQDSEATIQFAAEQIAQCANHQIRIPKSMQLHEPMWQED